MIGPPFFVSCSLMNLMEPESGDRQKLMTFFMSRV